MMIRSGPAVTPLLPGESRQSDLLEDAEHWAAVYEELTHFLDRLRVRDPQTMGRLCTRLEYWRHRRDELTP